MILCLGDSLTFGSIGYSYIKFLSPQNKVINKGKNGDTTKCAYQRLLKYLKNPKYAGIDTYIIEIGTNDIMLPYLADVSVFWKLHSKIRCAYKKCITDDKEFEKVYENYIRLLSAGNKRIILVGMPFIQMLDFPLESIKKRNKIICALAKKYNIRFVDTYALQQSLIESDYKLYSWGTTYIARFLDWSIMFIFPFFKDMLSKKRGLTLTVDGAHYNSTSAKKLAEAIDKALLL
jgi:lysophospholipase L1-like esterase